MGERFTIVAERWYAWQMFPGYVEDGQFCPYASPIYVEKVRTRNTSAGLFDVTFVNAAYTEGVQRSEVTFRMLKRTAAYTVAEIGGDPEITAVVGEISFDWLSKHFTDWWKTSPASTMPEPFRTDVQSYLERRLGLLHT